MLKEFFHIYALQAVIALIVILLFARIVMVLLQVKKNQKK